MLNLVIWLFHLAGKETGFPFFNYALVTSIVAGLTYFIPYLGCSLSVVVGLVLAYLQMAALSYSVCIGLIILLTNQFVDTFIRPKILGDALGVSTLYIIFCAIAGSEVMGVWGLLVGIPLGVMLVSIIRFIYKRFLAFPVSEEIMAPIAATEDERYTIPAHIEGTEGLHIDDHINPEETENLKYKERPPENDETDGNK